MNHFEISLVEPGGYARLEGVPKAWSRGTNGPVTAGVVLAPFYPDKEDRDEQDSLLDLYLRAMESAGSTQAEAA